LLTDGTASRAGNSAMTRLRSSALIAVQRAISSTVRPQPRQRPERASSVQILMQGLSIMDGFGRGFDGEHKHWRHKHNHS